MLGSLVINVLLKEVVYSIQYSHCGNEYIGETERPVQKRLHEHYLSAKGHQVCAPRGQHYKEMPPEEQTGNQHFQPFVNVSVVTRQSSTVNRRIAESVIIRERVPKVSQDSGWTLL